MLLLLPCKWRHLSSANKLCKQFGPRSGGQNIRPDLNPELFDSLIVLLKEFFEKVNFEKNQQTTNNVKLPSMHCGVSRLLVILFGSSMRENLILLQGTTKVQTSLQIRAVWSAPLLFSLWKVSWAKRAMCKI